LEFADWRENESLGKSVPDFPRPDSEVLLKPYGSLGGLSDSEFRIANSIAKRSAMPSEMSRRIVAIVPTQNTKESAR